MNESIVSNIKDLSAPKDLYYGEWVLDGKGLRDIALYHLQAKPLFFLCVCYNRLHKNILHSETVPLWTFLVHVH